MLLFVMCIPVNTLVNATVSIPASTLVNSAVGTPVSTPGNAPECPC